MSEFVTASGKPFDLEEVKRRAAQSKPRSRSSGPSSARSGLVHEDFMSLGFVVEGLTHAMLADARDARRKAIEGYDAACALAKEQNRAAPQKPLEFDEEQWRHTAKRVRVRSKPYEIKAAAEECCALALKSGWLVVSVVELRRERK